MLTVIPVTMPSLHNSCSADKRKAADAFAFAQSCSLECEFTFLAVIASDDCLYVQMGGIGFVHYNTSIEEQVSHIVFAKSQQVCTQTGKHTFDSCVWHRLLAAQVLAVIYSGLDGSSLPQQHTGSTTMAGPYPPCQLPCTRHFSVWALLTCICTCIWQRILQAPAFVLALL